jgi:S-formylglutathione hydrolase FrmB
MAFFNIKFNSDCLRRPVSFDMIIPNDPRKDIPWDNNNPHKERPMKTLFLLHGYYGCAGSWVPEFVADMYNIALVSPAGDNSFWLDGAATGRKYASFVGEELPDYLRRTFGLANGADDTYVMGLSMGGFGALHTGLAFPKQFGKIGAMSSALITHEVAKMKPGESNDVANYEYYHECFGDPSELLAGENNPETLALKLKGSGEKLPDIFLCCGTEDFLLENNRELHRFFEEHGIAHEYFESKGGHDMQFWGEYSEKIIKWMCE